MHTELFTSHDEHLIFSDIVIRAIFDHMVPRPDDVDSHFWNSRLMNLISDLKDQDILL